MSTETETGNIFRFDSQDILKFYNSPINSNKLPYSPTFSPNNKLVNEKEKKCKKYNIITLVSTPNNKQKISWKKAIIISFKFVIAFILLTLIILHFDFDDVLPYRILRDSYYKKILDEIPEENNEVIKIEEFGKIKTFLAPNIIKKFNQYIDICIKGKLLNNDTFSLSKDPKISVVMPLYKGGKYLHYSLRSIQNQKMKDIEIILIDDNSRDNTPLIIENYMKEDPRIKFIKNEVNRKVLYSKSMATLNSKGKYIIQLDQDDIFIRDDLFDFLYEEAEKNNLDLIQFRDITKNNFHLNRKTIVNCIGRHYILPKNNQYKTQPELKDTMYINNNVFLLWGLLIKADIYKKAIYYLWKIIINYQIIFHEDYLILFMIIILSQNYKYINYFSLIHLNNLRSSSNKHWNINEYYLSILLFPIVLSDNYIKNNPTDIKILINFIHLFIKEFTKGKNLYPNIFKTAINKILYNNKLHEDDRNFIINKFHIKNNIRRIVGSETLDYIINFQNENFLDSDYNNLSINCANNISISIIIICRQFKYLDKTIYSIEKQNFTNYEIILIYDMDKNNELDTIRNFIKRYPNINFINNYPKKGYLNSIFEGTFFCKGENIIILQPGYTLTHNNTLYELNNYIINNNEDILEFNLLMNNDMKMNENNLMQYYCIHQNSKVEKIIDTIKYNKKMREIDQEKELLLNKIIKTEIFKNLISKFKLKYDNKIVDNYYNEIILFSLSKTNYTFKHIDYFGIVEFSPIIEELDKDIYPTIIDDSIFYIDYLYENTNNSFYDKEIALNEFFELFGLIYNKFNKITKPAYNLYKKFYESNFISPSNKRLLRFYFLSLRK
jgi:glycosyltransferase involved in cell wall biosynthesis